MENTAIIARLLAVLNLVFAGILAVGEFATAKFAAVRSVITTHFAAFLLLISGILAVGKSIADKISTGFHAIAKPIASGFIAVIGIISGCAYEVPTPVSPAIDTLVSYNTTISGKWLLTVKSNDLDETINVTGAACSAHTYPISANKVFRDSVVESLEPLFQDLELVDNGIDRTSLARLGYKGQIFVESDRFDARIRFIPGFWNTTADSDAEISARVRIEGTKGRLLGGKVSGDGTADNDAGGFCQGGAESIAEAVSEAFTEMLERLAEKIGNAPALRNL